MIVFGIPMSWLVVAAVILLILWVWGWRRRESLRRKAKRVLGKPLVTSVLIPAVAILPPLFAAASDEKNNLAPKKFWAALRQFLNSYPWVRTAAWFWPAFIILAGYVVALLRRRYLDLDELTAKQYGFMLQSLDNTVGHKMKRFGEATSCIGRNPATLAATDIFQTITQPQSQREALINGVYLVFRLDAESVDPSSGDSLTVKLAKMDASMMFARFEVWLPADHAPNSTAEHLRKKECTLSRAAVTRQPIVVEDIQRELSKKKGDPNFVPGGRGSSEEGSLLVYPVVHQPTDSVPYVISLRSERKKHFKAALIPRYRILLQSFLIRISMEHSLSLLKEYHARTNH